MIIQPELLRPVALGQPDPFASLVAAIEKWVIQNQPDYMPIWDTLKCVYLRRILKLGKSGAYLRGQAIKAPVEELGSALMDIYELIGSSVYFTSIYWRAFTYWLDTGKLNPRWPQFGEKEVLLACSLLTEDEKDTLKKKASTIWVDLFKNAQAMDQLMKQVQPKIASQCRKRVRFLDKHDPALYSLEDLSQEVYCAVLTALRKYDTFRDDPLKMVGWVLKCADNAIHNLRKKASAEKRSKIIIELDEDDLISYSREVDLSFDDLLRVKQGDLTKEIEEADTAVCLGELLQKADPKINTYLRTIWGEHNPEFWTWFYHHEPQLAKREIYIKEYPEALGPYIQRHLKLPTWQLAGFLHQHLPAIFTKHKIKNRGVA